MRETCKGNDTDLGNMTAVPQRIVCLCTLVFIGDAESILQVSPSSMRIKVNSV